MNYDKKLKAAERLLEVMDTLREKCPWDREQTFESLRNNTIEETYELVDAIADGNMEGIKEELGDLLLHVIFYSKLGEEEGKFNFADVADAECDKLIYRHPHVYSDIHADTPAEVMQNWEALKLRKKKRQGGILGGVPRSLPAMVKAYRIGEKAASSGFDWEQKEDVWAKVKEEIAEIERACAIGYEMHTTAMQLCKPGVSEQYITGVLEGIAASYGSMVSFPIILTQHGETLHNHDHSQLLEAGKMMLTDCGAERVSCYCSDHTRTVPVGGKFEGRQKDIYNIVLACHDKALDITCPGITYKEVHLEVCKVLAQGLKDLGLMKGNVEEAVAAGAHALFLPHGLGHMMGLDVHDMEDLGQIYVGYDDEVRPSTQFGLASLRMGRRLKEGYVMTDEPGCYFIPALIDKWRTEKINAEFINFDELEKYKDFGGIRIEDDLLVTETGCRVLGKPIPKTVAEIEETMAQ